jgi:hypothetical protein
MGRADAYLWRRWGSHQPQKRSQVSIGRVDAQVRCQAHSRGSRREATGTLLALHPDRGCARAAPALDAQGAASRAQ